MHDIFGHIMLAIGDVDFLTSDQIMIAIFHRLGFDAGQISTGLWLGQIHCAGPAAFDHWRDKQFLMFGRCRFLQGVNLSLC